MMMNPHDEDEDEEARMRLFPALEYWVPVADSLARERKTMASYQKLSRQGAPGKSRNSSGEDPCKVPAQVRVTQFPNQSFYAYQNNLHCRVCKVQVMKKKSNVNDHTRGVNHIKSLQKDALSKVKTNGILEYITANKPALGFGSMTPITTDTRRLEMCTMFLNESLPFNKLDNSDPNSLRFALEKNDVKLPKRS
jgi:hypothetical protein